jgi:hypothetical protein
MQDVISMPLDFSGLQSALLGDHFYVVDSYAEPNYSYFEPTSVVSNCDIMDQLKKREYFMTSFKEEVFRQLSTLESSKAQTPSTPSSIAIQRRQPLVDINSMQSSPAAIVQPGINYQKMLCNVTSVSSVRF